MKTENDDTKTKPVGKVESRQAGKGSKSRPFNAKNITPRGAFELPLLMPCIVP